MPRRFAAVARAPGAPQPVPASAGSPRAGSRPTVGKHTATSLEPYRSAAKSHSSGPTAVPVEFDRDDYNRLFTKDENGKLILQYARLYALDIATQIITGFVEIESSFKSQFSVATESIPLEDIGGLPNRSDEWKAKYGKRKIRIRVTGEFMHRAKPSGFLVNMSIEALFVTGTDRGFSPVFQEVLGFIPLKNLAPPAVAPDPDTPSPPSVSPDDASRTA